MDGFLKAALRMSKELRDVAESRACMRRWRATSTSRTQEQKSGWEMACVKVATLKCSLTPCLAKQDLFLGRAGHCSHSLTVTVILACMD